MEDFRLSPEGETTMAQHLLDVEAAMIRPVVREGVAVGKIYELRFVFYFSALSDLQLANSRNAIHFATPGTTRSVAWNGSDALYKSSLPKPHGSFSSLFRSSFSSLRLRDRTNVVHLSSGSASVPDDLKNF